MHCMSQKWPFQLDSKGCSAWHGSHLRAAVQTHDAVFERGSALRARLSPAHDCCDLAPVVAWPVPAAKAWGTFGYCSSVHPMSTA